MFEKIRNWLKPHPGEPPAQAGVAQLRGGSEVPARKPHKPRSEKIVLPVPLSAKDQATADGKPYVTVLQLDIDTANPTLGSFELEWNDVCEQFAILRAFSVYVNKAFAIYVNSYII